MYKEELQQELAARFSDEAIKRDINALIVKQWEVEPDETEDTKAAMDTWAHAEVEFIGALQETRTMIEECLDKLPDDLTKETYDNEYKDEREFAVLSSFIVSYTKRLGELGESTSVGMFLTAMLIHLGFAKVTAYGIAEGDVIFSAPDIEGGMVIDPVTAEKWLAMYLNAKQIEEIHNQEEDFQNELERMLREVGGDVDEN